MTTPHSIADLRKSYERAELNEEASHAAPLQQFDQWLKEAMNAEVPEPNAMTLATVGSDLRPSTRIVLIKGYDDRGIVWFTNYDSRKGRQLAGNPFAALQFHHLVQRALVALLVVALLVLTLADGREIIYFDDSEPYVSGGATRRTGDGIMLAFGGRLSDGQIDAVVDHVRSSWGNAN